MNRQEKLHYRWATGEVLLQLRTIRGLSQGELAEHAGMTQSMVSRLESGRATLLVPYMQAVAAAVGLSPTEFVNLIAWGHEVVAARLRLRRRIVEFYDGPVEEK